MMVRVEPEGRKAMILSGDIGGTNTRLGLFDDDLRPAAEKDYPSREHASLEEILRDFLAETGASVRAVCLGVAGPVRKGKCRTTNLPWTIDAAAISRDLGLPGITLLNDLEATAHGIPALGPEDLVVLNPGETGAEGNAALIAAGTGLGEAGLFWDGREHRPFATEGGHASFAPRNEKETALLRHLLAQFDTVSWERVVSGPGLHQIYRFLRDSTAAEEPEWLEKEMREGESGGGDRAHGPVRGLAALRRSPGSLRLPLRRGGGEPGAEGDGLRRRHHRRRRGAGRSFRR